MNQEPNQIIFHHEKKKITRETIWACLAWFPWVVSRSHGMKKKNMHLVAIFQLFQKNDLSENTSSHNRNCGINRKLLFFFADVADGTSINLS